MRAGGTEQPGRTRRMRGRPGRSLVRHAIDHGLTAEQRQQQRARALCATPPWYRAELHVAATVAVGIFTAVVGIAGLRGGPRVRPSDLLAVPIVLVLANYCEWRLHKHLLHRRRWPLTVAYDLHTAMHHMIYVETDMAIRSRRELSVVLMPARFVALLVLGTTPIALLVGALWSGAAGWLFLMTAAATLVGYEMLHLSYHLPPHGFVGRLRWIGRLRAHHARHHDPRLMQRYNFNVTLPLFDWLMGTMAAPGGVHAPHPQRAASR